MAGSSEIDGTGLASLLATMGAVWTSGAPARTSPVVKSDMRSFTGCVARWESLAACDAYLERFRARRRSGKLRVLFDHV
jgi:hypothetical protein